MAVKLTAALVESFSGVFLSPRYDSPQPTPDFHREGWELYCLDHSQCALAAPRNHAKAQSLDSLVITPVGPKKIGELHVGDLVLGRDGYPIKVVELHPISEMTLYRVLTKDGRSTICNAEHLWSVYIPQNTGNKLVTLPLKELRKKAFAKKLNGYTEYRAFLPLSEPALFFPHGKDLDIPPYMLGVWLGDGHTADGRITSDDPEIFTWFDSKVIKQSAKYLYKVEGFRERLKTAGLLGNKHVPGLYLVSTPMERLALLQGLMDTDGTLHQDGKIAYFCNTNEALVEATVFLVRSLGGIAQVSTTVSARGATKTSYRVSVKLPASLNPFRLSRKASGWKGDDLKLAITEIKEIGRGLGRCITVDAPDGLYLTDDFLLTHNSTGFTHDFILANVCFRQEDYVILVGSSEDMAIEHLGDISNELRENEDLIREFSITGFVTDQKTDIIVECRDRHQFRIVARGAEQKIRGRKWKGKRPGLIVFDDIEDDEQVESKDRRTKFRRWFFRACKQALRDGGRIRGHGTILHEDSLLARLMKDKTWKTLRYRAHEGFDDFSNILWPEKFPESRLRAIRQEFIEQGDSAGYSQEYLNDPFDNEDQYLRRDDFLPMTEDDRETSKVVCAAADLAISTKQSADRTSITIGGKDLKNLLHVVDQRKGRWPADQIIEEMFSVQEAWNPDIFFVEDGQIWKTLAPSIYKEMQERDLWINFEPITSSKDKAARGRPFQKRHRAHAMRFDKDAEWYPEYEAELLRFTGYGQAVHDDQFDSTSLLVLGFESLANVEKEDFQSEEELEFEKQSETLRGEQGRSKTTGY